MAAHGNDTNQALTGLLGNFNVALQDRESDKLEKSRLNNENSKLWKWSNDLKKERDASIKEIRTLCARVVELERLLSSEGISIPPPAVVNPSPFSGISSTHTLSPAETYAMNSDSNQRPYAGPRSASDNGSNTRDRQISSRSDRERERSGTVTLPASHSMNSFTTASSMESLPSYTSTSRDRDRKPRAGASTPPIVGSSKSLTPQSHNSPFIGGSSPGRSREVSNNSLPPLSSSASFNQSNFNVPSSPSSQSTSNAQSQPSMVGLATIPSTPVVNNADRPIAHDADYTNSPIKDTFHLSSHGYTHGRAGERERSDTGSSSGDHLRIARSSPLPSSPALSSHSAGSSSLRQTSHHSGGSNSQQPSPRSPRFARDAYATPGTGSPYIEGPTQGSPRHPNFHPISQSRGPHSTSSQSSLPQYAPHTPGSAPTISGRRTLSRKASSLDLGHETKPAASQVPSRSITPPPDLGSPNTSTSPVQYAFAPKTPPVSFDQRFVGSGEPMPGSRAIHGTPARGTPMMDLPDEARHYILNNGSGLPSPVNSLDQRNERDRTAQSLTSQVSWTFHPCLGLLCRFCSKQIANSWLFLIMRWKMGGLGISDVGLGQDAVARHRNISNVLNNEARITEGRASAASMRSDYNGLDSSATAGVLQDAYESSLLDEPINTSSTVQGGRPTLPERTTSNDPSNKSRGYGTSSLPLAPVTQYASQPLPFRQNSDQSGPFPLQQPPLPSQSRHRDDYGTPQAGAAPNYGNTVNPNAPAPKCVPLVPGLLGMISTEVVNSSIKSIDRGREAVVFHVRVALSRSMPPDDPRHALIASNAPSAWIVEKTWNDLQSLDQTVRNKNSRSALRKVPSLPEKHLFKDHAPARVDQRKVSSDLDIIHTLQF